jgi:phosphoribosyl 1,2-cyclic phosphodiesterase
MSQAALTILGCSSGQPQPDRACSGYLLHTGESLSLIDCGGGVTSSFLRHGFDPLNLDRVFISHTHADHCCELPLMIQLLHVLSANRPLDVFIPDEYVRPFIAQLNSMYLFPQHIRVELRIHGYADGFGYNGDEFRLFAIANTHLEKAAEIIEQYDVPNRMQCHSFRIETETGSLLYSSDLGGLDDIADQFGRVNHALVESTHIDLERFFALAAENRQGRFVLTHLGDAAELSRLKALVKSSGIENVRLAEEGLRIEF